MSRLAVCLPASARHVLIAVNPHAGARSGASKTEQLRKLLCGEGYEVEMLADRDEVAAKAALYKESGQLRAVVAAGGDGTAAELINRTPPGTPLALLPMGTENLLANYVRQNRSPRDVLRTIRDGLTVRLDAGRAGGRLFLLMVSAGFDAEVVRRLHQARAGHISHWTYAKPIWETIRSYEYPEMRVYCQTADAGWAKPISARWVFGINLPRYARGLRFAPAATATDGLLDVCTFRRGSLFCGLWYLAGVVSGGHRRYRDCTMVRCPRLRIEADVPVPYQLDGDVGGWLPVEVEVLARRITLVVPRVFASSQGFQLPS